jgi:uncharacterized protein (DUF3820 family)
MTESKPNQQEEQKPSWEEYVMPFGKYKGKTLLHVSTVNPRYINWLLSIDLFPETKKFVQECAEFIESTHEYEDDDWGHPGNPAYYGDGD